VSIERIREGEKIAIDYGSGYWEEMRDGESVVSVERRGVSTGK
jgi:hypothetical protein